MNAVTSIPTDIIYKFISIFGLLVLLVYPAYIIQLRQKTFNNLLQISKELEEVKIKILDLKRRSYVLKNNSYIHKEDQLNEELILLEEEKDILLFQLEFLNVKRKEASSFYKAVTTPNSAIVVFSLGLIISSLGFISWYFLHQQTADKILELKLEEHEYIVREKKKEFDIICRDYSRQKALGEVCTDENATRRGCINEE